MSKILVRNIARALASSVLSGGILFAQETSQNTTGSAASDQAGQPTQPSDIPVCTPSPDDSSHYPDNMVRPKYPKNALRNGIEGRVELRAVIAPDGKTKDMAVLSSNSEFSQNAIAAIQKWRFHPELKQGQPVQTTYKIHVRFSPILQEANSDVELESPLPEPPSISLAKPDRQDLGPDIHQMSEPGIAAPKQFYSPGPEFSERARKAGKGGAVTISLIVGVDGNPRNLRVECSSAPDLAVKAIEEVKTWKFEPGTKDGKPVMVQIAVEVQFRRL
jgi:TonB family protein